MQEKPTLKEFAPRFIDGYAKANRLKPSGIAAKKSILSVHLIPLFGDRRLDAIQHSLFDQDAADDEECRELLRLRRI